MLYKMFKLVLTRNHFYNLSYILRYNVYSIIAGTRLSFNRITTSIPIIIITVCIAALNKIIAQLFT